MAKTNDESKDIQVAAADEKSRITLPKKIDIQFMEEAGGARAQSMAGFNPRYKDFVDWIIGITHEIWEEKGIGKLYDYYANTIKIHTSDRMIYGREAVFAMTIEALAGYPDRRLYGDEVIWGGNDVEGLYSSHRLTHVGTNRGWSVYGPPTGKRVRYSGVADCFCKRNMVVEEWIIRDELTLGDAKFGVWIRSRRRSSRRRRRGTRVWSCRSPATLNGASGSIRRRNGKGRNQSALILRLSSGRCSTRSGNWRLLNKTREFYAENFVFDGPSRRAFKGGQRVSDFRAVVVIALPRSGALSRSFLSCRR